MEKQLRAKEAALLADTTRLDTKEGKAALLQVQDALIRLDDGAFGTCLACGKAIESGRLIVAPWIPYCLRDQLEHEQR